MNTQLQEVVRGTCDALGNDRGRLMDVVLRVQREFGCVDDNAIDLIAALLSVPRVDVDSVVGFYAFLSKEKKGKVVIRLCNDVADKMAGADHIAEVLSEEAGIAFGETTPDGLLSLEWTPCIGMSDQAPAAMVNEVIVTELTTDSARRMVQDLKEHGDPSRVVHRIGTGNNAHDLVRSMVRNNIRLRGPVIFEDWESGHTLDGILAMTPAEVIRLIKTARLRGRGGAGFPTGMKWEFTRAADGEDKYIVCNADEGEPGTFKDRVILTECPDLMIEGMTVAAYAIGAKHGIIYLRGEYEYLRPFLEDVLARHRKKGLLGSALCGKQGCFDFDIRIQMGAGAYICGEETALLSSCEGLRGDPKTRPPFPAQKGYLGNPTCVNNVETLCCVARIVEKGSGWFAQMGSKGSPGTKLLSISGDVLSPGVYEFPFGVRLDGILKIAGAQDPVAVQMGGPSGCMVGPADFERTLCYDDLATGGSLMVFSKERNVLEVAHQFMEFFVDESCGYCVPCRVGNVLLKDRLEQILAGKGEPTDVAYLESLCNTIKTTSRCGLGQTSPNPVQSTLASFRGAYDTLLKEPTNGMQSSFDIHQSLEEAAGLAGRPSVHFANKNGGQ